MIGRYEPRRAADAVRAQRARTLAVLEALDAEAWEHTITPGWRTREVAAHLIASDAAGLTGRILRLGLRAAPVEAIEAWNDEQVRRIADRPIPDLLHGLQTWGTRVARAVTLAPAGLRIPGPFGRVSVAWLGMMRVYDEWIHEQDLRRALGWGPDPDPGALHPVIEHLPAVIVVQTLPLLPPSGSGAVALAVEDRPGAPFVVDLERRRYGVGLAATATVRGPGDALVMVAAGRDPWRDLAEENVLVIEGDRTAAEVFLDHLRAV